ncbi:MAG: type I glyceraldehyde-3-phosphate dehydrogenase [Bacteroidetes bacterium]|nr:type I glyceraldehyde-3-phosphate dehydrogenase [Bacteroidota bacterium]MBP6426347.1 type I glyceraldehyde-3-phosphate dehydrogenase [Bacteroidia bacterium]MBK8365776.1 type I glyceraldehyde-3-phosphate dehydrogenase [Bacteroidota bacterium]MBK9412471.1 type I glyceraldehyde-3-phosphate dehydrogenase [Bacteroidota bacterium]MBL0032226.1 type I glyceraldehyde-3-phosphate dehydrogenase [Bacteroidota bacterium]
MKRIKIAINGFGRIGRISTRVLLQNSNLELVAINDLADAATLAHLFKYDSIHRKYKGTVSSEEKTIIIDGNKIPVYSEKNPGDLPWSKLGVDIVLECTGHFTNKEGAEQHIKAGAKRVIISGPTKGKSDIKTIVLGVNDEILTAQDIIISNASCTTNNAAPMLKILDSLWEVENAFVTTVHSYTGDQNIHDAPHKDLRRARAAAVSIIPTTTGAAKALGDVLPHLNGKLGGAGIRIPAPDGSLTDITCILKKKVTLELINSTFKKYAEGEMKGIMEYTEDPIVSIDIVGNPNSCIFDSQLTTVLDKMVKVVGWYDNEAGYSNRLVELAEKVGKMIDK